MPVILLFREKTMKLNKTDGSTNLLTVLLVAAITIMALIYLAMGGNWMRIRMNHGNDGLMANTADSIARINSNNGQNCCVDGCGSTGHCPHYTTIGYVGYFDNIGNKIVGEKPKGYNEYTKMEIHGHDYYGEPGTMVIKVVAKEGNMVLSWELGKQ